MVLLTRRAILFGVAGTLVSGRSVFALEPPPRVRAWRWQGKISASRSAQSGNALPAVGDVSRAPYAFTAIGVSWARSIKGVMVRVSNDGSTWSNWQPVTTHEMHGKIPPPGRRFFGDLVIVATSLYVQVGADGAMDDVWLELIDSASTIGGLDVPSRIAAADAISIVPRSGWGCDESLRFDKLEFEIWPVEKQTTEKVVIHHTATPNNATDSAAIVRAIYYYHAVSQGWGDIGYNYLVDTSGKIFEGRYGGPGTVAGHAYGHNSGSMGVACIGTYSDIALPAAARRSLALLIAQQARYLDPKDGGWFVDGDMMNLIGHRDAMQYRPAVDATECPGNSLYGQLGSLRDEVIANLGSRPVPGLSVTELHLDSNIVLAGGTTRVFMTVKNTGTGTVTSQDPMPPLLYTEGVDATSRGFPGRVSAWRVGMDLSGGETDYPYRWGLPTALEPGQSISIEGQIRLNGKGIRSTVFGTVREYRNWQQREVFGGNLHVIDSNTLNRRTVVPLTNRRNGP